ncbi:Aminotransferase-like, plant mobile domain [Sesbania bispinosa]|nr:Aminotransferase-like, plant mobile domain [Sesbania bispinosa]
MERWHRETSSFHFPVGEMTITLDDVSTLLHLPDDKQLLVSALKVSPADAISETEITSGAYVRLSWLRDVYKSNIESRNLNAAARAYLLHLVGCTIFADKSATTVRVTFLELFRDLRTVGKIAWGVAALAYLYEQLKDASCHNTRQLAGYTTLLQAWIMEHFPHFMHIERSPDYVEGNAIVTSFGHHMSHTDLIVHFMKSTGHPSVTIRSVPVPPMIDIHDQYLHYEDHLLDAGRRGSVVTHAGEFIHGYLDWEEGTSTGTQGSTAHEGITQRLEALLRTDMYTAGSDGERLTHKALRMAQVGKQDLCTRISRTYQRKRRGGDGSTS